MILKKVLTKINLTITIIVWAIEVSRNSAGNVRLWVGRKCPVAGTPPPCSGAWRRHQGAREHPTRSTFVVPLEPRLTEREAQRERLADRQRDLDHRVGTAAQAVAGGALGRLRRSTKRRIDEEVSSSDHNGSKRGQLAGAAGLVGPAGLHPGRRPSPWRGSSWHGCAARRPARPRPARRTPLMSASSPGTHSAMRSMVRSAAGTRVGRLDDLVLGVDHRRRSRPSRGCGSARYPGRALDGHAVDLALSHRPEAWRTRNCRLVVALGPTGLVQRTAAAAGRRGARTPASSSRSGECRRPDRAAARRRRPRSAGRRWHRSPITSGLPSAANPRREPWSYHRSSPSRPALHRGFPAPGLAVRSGPARRPVVGPRRHARHHCCLALHRRGDPGRRLPDLRSAVGAAELDIAVAVRNQASSQLVGRDCLPPWSERSRSAAWSERDCLPPGQTKSSAAWSDEVVDEPLELAQVAAPRRRRRSSVAYSPTIESPVSQ